MSEKLWVRSQNAYSEAFWTSSTDRVPRIRTLRDRISRGMTVVPEHSRKKIFTEILGESKKHFPWMMF